MIGRRSTEPDDETHVDDEDRRAAELVDEGGLTVGWKALDLDRFQQAVGSVKSSGLDTAVDADGNLVVAMPSPEQAAALRGSLPHGRREFDAALFERVGADPKAEVYDVADLSRADADALLADLAGAGVVASIHGGELVVGRKDRRAAEGVIDAHFAGEGDQLDAGGSRTGGADAAPKRDSRNRPLASRNDIASISKRLVAGAFDVLFLVSLMFTIGQPLSNAGVALPVIGAIVAAIVFVYYTVLTRLWGQTMGKRVVGIKVVERGTDDVPSWETASRRALLPAIGFGVFFYLPAAPMFVWMTITLNPDRQGLHDYLAKTMVVDKPGRR